MRAGGPDQGKACLAAAFKPVQHIGGSAAAAGAETGIRQIIGNGAVAQLTVDFAQDFPLLERIITLQDFADQRLGFFGRAIAAGVTARAAMAPCFRSVMRRLAVSTD